MRNSKFLQEAADNCAKEHGFLCASYRGCSGEQLIYEPLCSNSENNPCIPTYILICKYDIEFLQGMEYGDTLDGIKKRDFSMGRSIYKALYQKFQAKNFECKDEESEEHSIVVSQLGPKKPWINKNILYDYLEIAHRLGMKVKLYPNKEKCIDNDGNWMYHVELRSLCV
ncbi:MAG: hypothetical protein J6W75_02860 [Bacteroidaceae bacterium]|nr:hypothetical protein [Prevotella sp.]MBP5770284.1 hypothetical protein [Bacteroidaceae bacterium]